MNCAPTTTTTAPLCPLEMRVCRGEPSTGKGGRIQTQNLASLLSPRPSLAPAFPAESFLVSNELKQQVQKWCQPPPHLSHCLHRGARPNTDHCVSTPTPFQKLPPCLSQSLGSHHQLSWISPPVHLVNFVLGLRCLL